MVQVSSIIGNSTSVVTGLRRNKSLNLLVPGEAFVPFRHVRVNSPKFLYCVNIFLAIGFNVLLVFIPISVCHLCIKFESLLTGRCLKWATHFTLRGQYTLILSVSRHVTSQISEMLQHAAAASFLAIIPLSKVIASTLFVVYNTEPPSASGACYGRPLHTGLPKFGSSSQCHVGSYIIHYFMTSI
jgi:hypothetical protein